MSAVPVTCPACATTLAPGVQFCSACGTHCLSGVLQPATAVTTDPAVKTVLRGTIMRDTNAGSGLIRLSDSLKPFMLENQWRSTVVLAVQMLVDVELNASGAVACVTPVPDSVQAKEKLSEL